MRNCKGGPRLANSPTLIICGECLVMHWFSVTPEHYFESFKILQASEQYRCADLAAQQRMEYEAWEAYGLHQELVAWLQNQESGDGGYA